jgi:hypothetical protein
MGTLDEERSVAKKGSTVVNDVNRIRPRAVTPRVSPFPAVQAPQAVVAQLVEQLIRNQQVSGSNPLNGSKEAEGRSS